MNGDDEDVDYKAWIEMAYTPTGKNMVAEVWRTVVGDPRFHATYPSLIPEIMGLITRMHSSVEQDVCGCMICIEQQRVSLLEKELALLKESMRKMNENMKCMYTSIKTITDKKN